MKDSKRHQLIFKAATSVKWVLEPYFSNQLMVVCDTYPDSKLWDYPYVYRVVEVRIKRIFFLILGGTFEQLVRIRENGEKILPPDFDEKIIKGIKKKHPRMTHDKVMTLNSELREEVMQIFNNLKVELAELDRRQVLT